MQLLGAQWSGRPSDSDSEEQLDISTALYSTTWAYVPLASSLRSNRAPARAARGPSLKQEYSYFPAGQEDYCRCRRLHCTALHSIRMKLWALRSEFWNRNEFRVHTRRETDTRGASRRVQTPSFPSFFWSRALCDARIASLRAENYCRGVTKHLQSAEAGVDAASSAIFYWEIHLLHFTNWLHVVILSECSISQFLKSFLDEWCNCESLFSLHSTLHWALNPQRAAGRITSTKG